uniref:C2H2-type domain-containing protein n=1 Tax=Clastoptera arizonana TaxID=38151 RepID=A0A1B6DAW9_9HEMI
MEVDSNTVINEETTTCGICSTFMLISNGYNIYLTAIANGQVLLQDSFKKMSDLKVEVFESNFICKRCYMIFDELELSEIRCNELRKIILDYFRKKKTLMRLKDNDLSSSLFESSKDFVSSQKEIVLPGDKQKKKLDLSLALDAAAVFSCNSCDRVFKRSCDLKNHMKIHNKISKKLKFDIHEENKIVRSTGHRQKNILTTNDENCRISLGYKKTDKEPAVKNNEQGPEKTPYKCETCGMFWQRAKDLKLHEKTHSVLRPYICEICGQAYKKKHALNVHVGMHKGINPFSCSVCGKSFTQKGALQRHAPLHTGQAPHQCELCGKRYVHHTSFNMHMLAHTGNKSYKCQVCGLKLISNSHLKRHSRIHTGERPFSCNYCSRRFAEKYNLMTHLRTHCRAKVGSKSHVCQDCGLSFVLKSKLNEHLSMCHNKVKDVTKSPWIAEMLSQGDLENGDVSTPIFFT